MKIRFIEPGNLPYRRSLLNYFVYDKYIRTPSHGLLTLATIVNRIEKDVLIYSESISKILWGDVLDADVVLIGIFTFNAKRGYELADYIRKNSKSTVAIGGLHATLNYEEAALHCDHVIVGEGDETLPEYLECIRTGRAVNIPGVAYQAGGRVVFTGERPVPQNIDVIPDRNLLYNYKKMVAHNTIWPQVHASRGCPHNCDYCALVHAFGRTVRTRSPENVVEDIRQAITFHDNGRRLARVLWITDDNFFADRDWAVRVLNAMIDSGIRYGFAIQARYEVGFDDEMLALLKRAGFFELAIGIEFLEDEAFTRYHKKCTYPEILCAVKNIQNHGLRVRGLFIVGADNHEKGVGDRLADFVIQNDICGVLIQSMYFVPGTPVYETHKDRLLHGDWSKCTGNVVHFPEKISPFDLQNEIIYASRKIYSFKRLTGAIFKYRGIRRILFIGEYFWQIDVRKSLSRELPALTAYTKTPAVPE